MHLVVLDRTSIENDEVHLVQDHEFVEGVEIKTGAKNIACTFVALLLSSTRAYLPVCPTDPAVLARPGRFGSARRALSKAQDNGSAT